MQFIFLLIRQKGHIYLFFLNKLLLIFEKIILSQFL